MTHAIRDTLVYIATALSLCAVSSGVAFWCLLVA
jgi:hypothetical protein